MRRISPPAAGLTKNCTVAASPVTVAARPTGPPTVAPPEGAVSLIVNAVFCVAALATFTVTGEAKYSLLWASVAFASRRYVPLGRSRVFQEVTQTCRPASNVAIRVTVSVVFVVLVIFTDTARSEERRVGE